MENTGTAAGRRLLTLADAALRAQTSQKTIRRRIAEGHLPAMRMAGSRLLRIDPADLDALFRPVPTTTVDVA